LSSVVEFHSPNSYSAAVDLALQAKDVSLCGAANVLPPPPELHHVCRATSEDRKRPCDPFSAVHRSSSTTRPPTRLSVSRKSPASPTQHLSALSNANSNPTNNFGLGIRYNRRISPPAHFATCQSPATKVSHSRPPKIEDPALNDVNPTRKGTVSKDTSPSSETPKQHRHSKNSDKRKGVIITSVTSDIAMASISVSIPYSLQTGRD
jgi:hypothetical protein